MKPDNVHQTSLVNDILLFVHEVKYLFNENWLSLNFLKNCQEILNKDKLPSLK